MVEAIIVILIAFTIAYYASIKRRNGAVAARPRAALPSEPPPQPRRLDSIPGVSAFTLKLSGSNLQTTIKSRRDKSAEYAVDLSAQTCTCPDFVETRTEFEFGDPRRFCKHMVKAAINADALEKSPAVFRMVFENALEMGKGLTRDALFLTEIDGSLVLISQPETGDWINVFCRNRNPRKDGTYSYKRFGFSLSEQRWSYGYGPPGAKILRKIFSVLR
ncbi:MAG: hypothetical protein MUC33_01240 [Desulfobacterales bacterium]|jgi:hypothetical protein|nr:hypothetical protein [Desulfobacterales bacterium]MCU0601267.1 hypothetical protein [Desulfobacterales bacterium]